MNIENSVATFNSQGNARTSTKFRNTGYDDENEYGGDVVLDESDQIYLSHLLNVKRHLNSAVPDYSRIIGLINEMNQVYSLQHTLYVDSILSPETKRGSKIPSVMPLPSSSFQLRQTFNVATNAQGNAVVIVNPFFLANSSSLLSTVFLNNNVALDGVSSSNFFNPINIGQGIPAVYSQYRLVSGSLCVKYVGRLDTVQGIIGGAIICDTNAAPALHTPAAVQPNLAKYANFNAARDSYFNMENYSLQGIRQIYFPLDPSFDEYLPLNTSKNGFNFLVYIQNCPPSASSFKFDLCLNFECLADSDFLNYIPTSIYDGPIVKKDDLRKAISTDVIMKESEFSKGIKSIAKNAMTALGQKIKNIAASALEKFIMKV